MQKITVVALGCPKNTVESEYLLGVFRSRGFEITNNIEEADISHNTYLFFYKNSQRRV
jgi:ribosomal protein S12 methylthiotransferase